MTLAIQASLREEAGKGLMEMREQGSIPVVLYGHKVENKNLTVKFDEFAKVFNEAGQSSLVDLKMGEGAPIKVLIQDVQYDPVRHRIIHADLYQVKMDEKITAEIPFVFVGESLAVKSLGGVLVTAMHQIEVKCLPGDLVKEIEVDLSALENMGSKILIKDLGISDKLEISADLEAMVAGIIERVEEKEEAPVTEAVPAEGAATVPDAAAGAPTEEAK